MSTTRGASSINTNFDIQHRPTHSTRLLTGTHHTAGFLPRLLNTCAANQQVCSAKRHPTHELHAIQQMRPSAARNQLAVQQQVPLLPCHTTTHSHACCTAQQHPQQHAASCVQCRHCCPAGVNADSATEVITPPPTGMPSQGHCRPAGNNAD